MFRLTPILLVICVNAVVAADTVLKSESFDRDPGWDAFNNRVTPKSVKTVVQDFGYSPTHFAGREAGEMGGRIARASEPAWYADKIAPKTLDDRLSASGTFALTHSTAGSGIFFGFFNANQPGASGRPIGSLGLDMDCEKEGGRLAVRLITGKNQSCGTFITPYVPGQYRPTPIRNDGTRYAWTLEYDPQGADGRGRFTFTFRQGDADRDVPPAPPDGLPEAHRREALKRFPYVASFSVDLREGFRQQGTTFDHFGVMNLMKPGGTVTIHFDDLAYDGRRQDFAADPHWDGTNNRATYPAREAVGAHDFGFSNTSGAGGAPGEAGGAFWRTGKWGYYADRVGTLSFDDRLEARGRVVFAVGGPDADMCFGWFRADKDGPSPLDAGDFIGIKVGGPTRVGHMFLPACAAAGQVRAQPDRGPVLEPGRRYDWSFLYDPAAGNGSGSLTTTLGAESVTLTLKPDQRARAKESRLDHFGLFSTGPGGQVVKLYLDDLHYTAAAAK